MGVSARRHRHELDCCVLHRALYGRVSGEHLANPPGSEFLPVRRRRAGTIFSGRGDSAVLLVSAVLDVSAEIVREDLGLSSEAGPKRELTQCEITESKMPPPSTLDLQLDSTSVVTTGTFSISKLRQLPASTNSHSTQPG